MNLSTKKNPRQPRLEEHPQAVLLDQIDRDIAALCDSIDAKLKRIDHLLNPTTPVWGVSRRVS